MDNSQWLSVKDIVSKYKKFNVPSLQRTYRWGEKEITLLLNDLYEFYNTNKDSTNDFYPLQPLILKKSNKNAVENLCFYTEAYQQLFIFFFT